MLAPADSPLPTTLTKGCGTLFVVIGRAEGRRQAVIDGAKQILSGDTSFCFAPRLCTRVADSASTSDKLVTLDEMVNLSDGAGLALSWTEGDTELAIVSSIGHALRTGKIVVVNGDRAVVQTAIMKYKRVRVLNIGVSFEALAEQRGLELDSEAAQELQKEIEAEPQGEHVVYIDNDGKGDDNEEAITKLVVLLQEFLPKPPAEELAAADEAADEELRMDWEALHSALARKASADGELRSLDRDLIAQLKTYKVPPEAVLTVLQAVLVLLGNKSKHVSTWDDCRSHVSDSGQFLEQLLQLEPLQKISKSLVTAASQLLGSVGAAGAEAASVVASLLYRWATQVIAVQAASKKVAPTDVTVTVAPEEASTDMEALADALRAIQVPGVVWDTLDTDDMGFGKQRYSCQLCIWSAAIDTTVDDVIEAVEALEGFDELVCEMV